MAFMEMMIFTSSHNTSSRDWESFITWSRGVLQGSHLLDPVHTNNIQHNHDTVGMDLGYLADEASSKHTVNEISISEGQV